MTNCQPKRPCELRLHSPSTSSLAIIICLSNSLSILSQSQLPTPISHPPMVIISGRTSPLTNQWSHLMVWSGCSGLLISQPASQYKGQLQVIRRVVLLLLLFSTGRKFALFFLSQIKAESLKSPFPPFPSLDIMLWIIDSMRCRVNDNARADWPRCKLSDTAATPQLPPAAADEQEEEL